MIINSLDQLNKISLKIIKKISKDDCILLYGEIGVGKTTLTRALINNLQKNNDINFTEVLSPTYNILYEYEIQIYKIMHYDLYRLKNESDVQQLAIFNQDINCIKLIEWPEIIKEKPLDRLEIYISHSNKKNTRILEFKGFGKWKNFNEI
jgi:tRNA threonylcarbamoyladenosine biosynthesis protein TsaE|tara:strand:- start:45 stop:494 length:450 start_codon:yes stop_codon:yes gene_type:complete